MELENFSHSFMIFINPFKNRPSSVGNYRLLINDNNDGIRHVASKFIIYRYCIHVWLFGQRKTCLKSVVTIDGFQCNEPEGAFYVFPDISAFFGKTLNGVAINNASDFAMYLLEHANVATVTGDAFGNPKGIRISYAASEKEIREAISRIVAVL